MQVAGRLWELVVRRAELRLHLEALKDYFLLARGDFWDCFLVDAQRLLALPPNQVTADVDIRQPFQAAGSKTSAAGDPLFANFSARWLREPQKVGCCARAGLTAGWVLGAGWVPVSCWLGAALYKLMLGFC